MLIAKTKNSIPITYTCTQCGGHCFTPKNAATSQCVLCENNPQNNAFANKNETIKNFKSILYKCIYIIY